MKNLLPLITLALTLSGTASAFIITGENAIQTADGGTALMLTTSSMPTVLIADTGEIDLTSDELLVGLNSLDSG